MTVVASTLLDLVRNMKSFGGVMVVSMPYQAESEIIMYSNLALLSSYSLQLYFTKLRCCCSQLNAISFFSDMKKKITYNFVPVTLSVNKIKYRKPESHISDEYVSFESD